MKSKIITLTLVGLLAGSIAASAQTNDSVAVADASAPQPNAVIPLISFDDVLLTDAIKNLARQAGLNYMLDPKVSLSYVQPGADGRANQPTVSIRWENITAGQALMALLNNYQLQLIQDPKTGIARITVKDPAAPDPLLSRVIQLKYADPKDMLVAVQTALTDDKRSRAVADVRTSQLVVLATEKQFAAVDEMIMRLDSATKQVLIEAKIYETSSSPSTSKGINWSGTLSAQNLSFGNNLQQGVVPTDSATPPLATKWPKVIVDTAKGFNPATAFLNADGVNAVFAFLNSDTDTRVVASPRAVTLDNQTAILSSTRATPIFNTTAGTQGSPGGSSVTYSNLGVILNVTPRISANNDIQLKVIPEVSSDAGPSKAVVVAGVANQAELFDIRRIDTQVLIPSGNTLVLGGLLNDVTTKGYTKVPIMGDVPGLGFFFRSKSKQQDMKNLLIFITPTIVTADAFRPTKTDFLNSTTENKPYLDPTVWDSAKPLDWSDTGSSESAKTARNTKTK